MACWNRLLTTGDTEDSVHALYLATVGCARPVVPRREWLAVVVERAEATVCGDSQSSCQYSCFLGGPGVFHLILVTKKKWSLGNQMCAASCYYVTVSVIQKSESNSRSFKNDLAFWARKGKIKKGGLEKVLHQLEKRK